MLVQGKIYTQCMVCGREEIREYTPLEAFKSCLYMPGYTMMYCPACKARHMHYHQENGGKE